MGRPSDPIQQLRQIAQDPKTAPDKIFVLMANSQSQYGEEISKQALQKATNPQVKQVAQRCLDDSQRAQQQLQPIAQQLGVQLPSDLQDDQRVVIRILAALPTEQFEKAYMCGAESENAAAMIRLRHVSQLSQNEQIRKFAQQQWSVASQRNDQIQQASAAVGLQSAPPEAVPAAGRLDP
jgi:putative membrane protein